MEKQLEAQGRFKSILDEIEMQPKQAELLLPRCL